MVIRIDSVVKGYMVASLLQRFGNKDEVLLTANDEKKLLAESTRNVVAETFDDTKEVVTPEYDKHISRTVKDMLISSRTSIQDQSDKMWESVFWNDDNYRPDKVSKTLNDVYQKLDKDKQKEVIESYNNTIKFNVGWEPIKLNVLKATLNNEGASSSKDVDKLFQETKAHVEWNGEKFIPKSLSLSRINLSQLRDTQSLKDRKVRVTYSTVVLSTPIHYDSAVTGKDEKRLFDLMSRTSSSVNEIEALVESGVNINCRNNREMTPLLQLLEVSHPNTKDIILHLIKNKVDLKAKDNEGRTALHVLCQNYTNDDIDEIAGLLIRNEVNIKAKDICGATALHLLCQYSKNSNIIEIVRRLIRSGVDVNEKTNTDWTALHNLCRYYQNNNLKEIIELLIKNKVDINSKTQMGNNPLTFLCQHYQHDNLKEIVRLLVENKVDINAKNNSGVNALLFVSCNYNNKNVIDIIRLLIQHGVDVNAKDSTNGFTAADYIRKNYDKSNKNDILKLLADGKQ